MDSCLGGGGLGGGGLGGGGHQRLQCEPGGGATLKADVDTPTVVCEVRLKAPAALTVTVVDKTMVCAVPEVCKASFLLVRL